MFNILIVDNDELLTHMMKVHLEKDLPDSEAFALNVKVARTPDEARGQVQAFDEPVDLLLIDYRLDGIINGIELAMELLTSAPNSDTMIFTGYSPSDMIAQLRRAGINDFLAKPFTHEELSWRVYRLLRLRQANTERDWLKRLSSVSEAIHAVNTVEQLAQAVTLAADRLNFNRARFYRILRHGSDAPIITGVAQAGLDEPTFSHIAIPLRETEFVREVAETERIRFFERDQPRPRFLTIQSLLPNFRRPKGDWVGVPIIHLGRCEAVLLMDSDQRSRAIADVEKRHLHLLAEQLSAAYSRVVEQEAHLLRRQAAEIAQRLGASLPNVDKTESLEPFCTAFQEQVLQRIPKANLVVAIHDRSDWVCEWMRYEEGVPVGDSQWRPKDANTMISYLVTEYHQPLWLPQGTEDFRKEHGLRLVEGGKPAKVWMGVPFKNGDEVVGAIILEHDEHADAFTYDDFALLCELGAFLGNRLYATWLNLQRKRLAERLAFVQRAAEDIMLLAEQNEKWLWHAVLTIATAHFGFSFDRALLLLRDGDKPVLRGQMAIGHERWSEAERDWKRVAADRQAMKTQWVAGELVDDSLPMAYWHRYLDDLRREHYTGFETPLNSKLYRSENDAAQLVLDLDDQPSVLSQVLTTHKAMIVTAEKRKCELPRPIYEFLYAGHQDSGYEETDSVVVPVTAGDETIGLLLLDNVWSKEPPQLEALRYIDTLTNQAAVLFQNRIQDATRIELDGFKHQTLNRISDQIQPNSLSEICDKAKTMLAADRVAIYPVEALENAQFQYGEMTAAGMSDGVRLRSIRWSSVLYPLDSRVLLQEQVRAVDSTQGLQLHPYVVENNVRAMMIVPVVGGVTGSVRAVMYVDYQQKRTFTLREMQLAREFAALAATVLRQYRQMDAKSRREHELEKSARIFSRLLQRSSQQRLSSVQDIVRLVLAETAELLNQEKVSLMLALREWQRNETDKVYEVRKEFVLHGDSVKIEHVETDVGKGVRGRVLEEGNWIYIDDVEKLAPDLEGVYQPTRADARSKIYVPIPGEEGESPLGILVAESPDLDAFSAVQRDTMLRIATAAGMVIHHLRRQVWMSDILDAVSQISLPTDLDETLDQIGRVIHRAMPEVDIVTIWQRKAEIDPEPLVCGLATGPAKGMEEGRELLASRRPIIAGALHGNDSGIYVDDTSVLDQRPDSFSKRYGVHAYAAQKIMIDADVFGLLFLSYCHPHTFSDDERTFLPILASTIAAAINDARRLDAIQAERERVNRQKQRFEGALDITRAVGGSLDVDEIIANILDMLNGRDYFPDTTPAILLYDEYEEVLEFTPSSLACYEITNPIYDDLTFIELSGPSLVAATARSALRTGKKQVFYVKDISDYPADYLPLRIETRSQLTVALFNPEKWKLVGAFLLESTRPDAFDADARAMAELVATDVRIAVERGWETEDSAKSKMITTAYAGGSRIAHELRQEISVIATSCHLLDRVVPEKTQSHLAKIRLSIERLQSHATFAGEYSDRAQINLCAKLHEWLSSAIQQHSAASNGNPIQGTVICPTEITLETLPKRLGEVLEHLIRNSCEAFEVMAESREIKLTVGHSAGASTVEIVYEDSGPGVPEEMERRLFQTRRGEQSREGRGNGLLFAENIVKHDLKGTIHYVRRVRDGRTRGSKFVLRLPLSVPTDGMQTNGGER